MKNFEIKTETLTCPTCVKKIERSLITTKGIKNPKVYFTMSKVKGSFDNQILSLKDIENVIIKLGFNVEDSEEY